MSTKLYGEHPVVEGCTCPWNNGYIKAGEEFPHHITCPALTGTHTPDDKCCHVMGHFCKED